MAERERPGAALVLHSVERCYGAVTALEPLSMRLDPGAVVVIEGPNGAGKSTLLRVAAGVLSPSTGERWCAGRSLYLTASAGRRVERVRDVVRFALEVSGVAANVLGRRLDEALAESGLDRFSGRRIGALSSGERARLTIALLLATRPALGCVDEPFVHLDREGVSALRRGLARVAAEGTALLVAVHDHSPLEDLLDAGLQIRCGRARVVPRNEAAGNPTDGVRP